MFFSGICGKLHLNWSGIFCQSILDFVNADLANFNGDSCLFDIFAFCL